MYVFMGKLSLNYPCYPFLSIALVSQAVSNLKCRSQAPDYWGSDVDISEKSLIFL